MSFGALHVARTGLDAQSFRMQVIANNLANVNTTGFKRDRPNFATLSYQMITQPGATAAPHNRSATCLTLVTRLPLSGPSLIHTPLTFPTPLNSLHVPLDLPRFFPVPLPLSPFLFSLSAIFLSPPLSTTSL